MPARAVGAASFRVWMLLRDRVGTCSSAAERRLSPEVAGANPVMCTLDSSMVEHRTVNPNVAGSNPAPNGHSRQYPLKKGSKYGPGTGFAEDGMRAAAAANSCGPSDAMTA